MNTFFRYYRRGMRWIGMAVCLFLLLFTLLSFFFGIDGRESILKWLSTGLAIPSEELLCTRSFSVPNAPSLPLDISELTD